MLNTCYSQNKSLTEFGWKIGDTRRVHLAGSINEDVIFVIEDFDNVTSGGTAYKVSVGQKDGLSTAKQMNSDNTNSGGYNSSAMRTFVEGDYQTALQNATIGNFWSSVKSASHKSQIYRSGLQSTTAKVIIHSVFETNSNNAFYQGNSIAHLMPDETVANGFHQFDWYKTSSNRIKHQGINGYASPYWTRSVDTGGTTHDWNIYTDGTATTHGASSLRLVAPFCVL